MTYQELYHALVGKMEEAGIADAKFDARYLLEFVCKTNYNDLLLHKDRLVTKEQQDEVERLLILRLQRIPIQYILKECEFMGLHYYVTEDVLIPRQDTELLVEEVLKNLHDKMSVLDMCTGSGCILLSLLSFTNDCSGVGVDISSKALSVARENAKRLGIQATFLESDLFDTVEGLFDVVVSNPPYIKSKVIETLMPEVKDYEPMLALDGMDDGLFFYKRIAKEAKRFLVRGGMIFFEIGHDQAEEVYEILANEGYDHICLKKDYANNDRVVYATFVEDKNV